ncbi:MAG TPA: ATP-binding protein [Saprospiraceae bacterium]|nr:ATP-binding protein [Saprospiraceae bacterium]
MHLERSVFKRLKDSCFKNKVILLLGPRQVGKTTLLRKLQSDFDVSSKWLNVDEADVREELTNAKTSTRLLQLVGPNTKLVLIDEAQQVPDIGRKLKLLIDNYPHIQVIVSGSSALDLQNTTSESLTGRKREFQIFPFSFQELSNHTSILEEKRILNARLIYGSYPEVVNNPGNEQEVLIELANSYLYKDILQMDGIRKSSVLEKLLQALAFQVGSEVRYHELARTIGNIDTTTVEKYINLLEKAFIVFKLPGLNRNIRNEIKKGKKYYFFDNGIRNVLISNFNKIDLRQDIGAIWENYLLSERYKFTSYNQVYANKYFWRTTDQAEIDYLEERDGLLNAYEIKWTQKNVRFPNSFQEGYPDHKLKVIDQDNYSDFLTSNDILP